MAGIPSLPAALNGKSGGVSNRNTKVKRSHGLEHTLPNKISDQDLRRSLLFIELPSDA